jgi:hypothetical protein
VCTRLGKSQALQQQVTGQLPQQNLRTRVTPHASQPCQVSQHSQQSLHYRKTDVILQHVDTSKAKNSLLGGRHTPSALLRVPNTPSIDKAVCAAISNSPHSSATCHSSSCWKAACGAHSCPQPRMQRLASHQQASFSGRGVAPAWRSGRPVCGPGVQVAFSTGSEPSTHVPQQPLVAAPASRKQLRKQLEQSFKQSRKSLKKPPHFISERAEAGALVVDQLLGELKRLELWQVGSVFRCMSGPQHGTI